MINLDEEICVVKWTVRDIVNIMETWEIKPTDEMMEVVVSHLKKDLADLCIERGWEVIEEVITTKPWLS